MSAAAILPKPLVTHALIRAVLAQHRLGPHSIHGPAHWLRVCETGLALAAMTPGADAALVECFALLHDARRLSEGEDRAHGERAAAYARTLFRRGLLRIDPARLQTLADACADHEKGRTSPDPTIGACWDADRLELARLNVRPHPALLSTDAAKAPAMQAEAWERGRGGSVNRELGARWGIIR